MPVPARPSPFVALAACSLAASLVAGCSHAGHRSTAPSPAGPSATPTGSTAPARAPAVYPLTGLRVTDPAKARRPALSVKIDNISTALPQAGLASADIVTEALVEGGLTRLLATYQSHDAPLIGPIRSARPVDADLLRQLNGGYFAYSGAAPREIAPVRARSTALLISWDLDPTPFWTDPRRVVPHQVFSSTARLYAWGHRRWPGAPPPHQLFAYSATPPAGRPASAVHVAFAAYSSADWTWQPSAHDWARSQDGRPDVLVDGRRVRPGQTWIELEPRPYRPRVTGG